MATVKPATITVTELARLIGANRDQVNAATCTLPRQLSALPRSSIILTDALKACEEYFTKRAEKYWNDYDRFQSPLFASRARALDGHAATVRAIMAQNSAEG